MTHELLPCREMFELWYSEGNKNCPSIERCELTYKLIQTHISWVAWQAAWETCAALSSPLRKEQKTDIQELIDCLSFDCEAAVFKAMTRRAAPPAFMHLATEAVRQFFKDDLRIADALSSPADDVAGWQQIATANTSTPYILYEPGGGYVIGSWKPVADGWTDHHGNYYRPTHFMELPAPPEIKE